MGIELNENTELVNPKEQERFFDVIKQCGEVILLVFALGIISAILTVLPKEARSEGYAEYLEIVESSRKPIQYGSPRIYRDIWSAVDRDRLAYASSVLGICGTIVKSCQKGADALKKLALENTVAPNRYSFVLWDLLDHFSIFEIKLYTRMSKILLKRWVIQPFFTPFGYLKDSTTLSKILVGVLVYVGLWKLLGLFYAPRLRLLPSVYCLAFIESVTIGIFVTFFVWLGFLFFQQSKAQKQKRWKKFFTLVLPIIIIIVSLVASIFKISATELNML